MSLYSILFMRIYNYFVRIYLYYLFVYFFGGLISIKKRFGEVKAVVRDSKICLSDSELRELHLCVGNDLSFFESDDGVIVVGWVKNVSGSMHPNNLSKNKMKSFFFIPSADGGESVE